MAGSAKCPWGNSLDQKIRRRAVGLRDQGSGREVKRHRMMIRIGQRQNIGLSVEGRVHLGVEAIQHQRRAWRIVCDDTGCLLGTGPEDKRIRTGQNDIAAQIASLPFGLANASR